VCAQASREAGGVAVRGLELVLHPERITRSLCALEAFTRMQQCPSESDGLGEVRKPRVRGIGEPGWDVERCDHRGNEGNTGAAITV
jgi:hypothetical protein